jgi:hypothetical protein
VFLQRVAVECLKISEEYGASFITETVAFNPLNAELNPICHLLALLGGANIVVVSRLRVNPSAWSDEIARVAKTSPVVE